MSKAVEEYNSKFTNGVWRYFAETLGKYLEKEFKITREWKTTGWEGIIGHFDKSCIYCMEKRSDSVKLEKEHLHSTSTGGLDIKANVLPACSNCNKEKGNDNDWERFLLDKEKPNLNEAKIRINKINEYRENECGWKDIQDHYLFKDREKHFKFYTQHLEQEAFRWVTTIIHQDKLFKYAYHITTITAWKNAKQECQYPPKNFNSMLVHCSYEDTLPLGGLGIAISEDLELENEFIILSFDLEEINSNIYHRVVYPGRSEPYIDITGPISLDKIKPSKPFKVKNSVSIKEALSDIEWSLSYSGIKLPGSDFSIE
ncbi:HNH endonuclease signature motif containing protein [Bacillus toyonensis]|uniref:HNH endonuclease signature motif containing protein n=1 Tax=Bacillus toyonensis TaxID=155322 RepID=UPI000BFB4277|nr:HNH endonuclease signature motif containing protein [Bacillus toyonensis]PHE26938.1 hypothetical protein COF73_21665 [Bacillus toyonensis]